MSFPTKTLTWVAGDVRRIVFDLSDAPEVVASETLSSPTVAAVTGLTIGSPSVLAAETDGVAAGEGVSVLVTTSAAGTYIVTLSVSTSGGATLKVPVRLVVADPPTE